LNLNRGLGAAGGAPFAWRFLGLITQIIYYQNLPSLPISPVSLLSTPERRFFRLSKIILKIEKYKYYIINVSFRKSVRFLRFSQKRQDGSGPKANFLRV